LVADDAPSLVNKDWHTVHWDVLSRSPRIQEVSVLSLNAESTTNLLSFGCERVWLKNFVRHHDELKFEEVFRLRLGKLLWLVDLRPDLIQVLVDHGLDLFELNAVVVVAQHEEKFLRGLLVEKL